MSFQMIKARPHAWATCAIMVLYGTSASAQFVAVSAQQAQPVATPVAQRATVQQVARPTTQLPPTVYQQATVPQATVPQATVAPQTTVQPTVVPQVNNYQHPMYSYSQQAPAYRVAQAPPAPVEMVQEVIAPGVQQAPAATMHHQAPVHHQAPMHHQAPVQQDWSGYGATTANCNDCQSSGYPATTNYASAGCADGTCGSGFYADGGCASGVCGDSNLFSGVGCRPKRQWFAGFYALYMQRDNPGRELISFMVPDETAITTPYYPVSTLETLKTADAGTDPQWGGEVRFGATFGSGVGCGCQPFAWEVGYWGLDEDETSASMLITSPLTAGADSRMYGFKNMAGLEYDRDGAGATYAYRPMNDYYDYQVPVENPAPNDIRVIGQRVRQRFQAQNVEINIWKFGTPTCASPLMGGRLSGALGAGLGSNCGSDCGTACGTTCSTGSCRPPRRFFINGLCGIRYMRLDDDLYHDLQFTTVDGTGVPNAGEPTAYTGFPADDNTILHDIETDNQMVGFQLGCSMNWLVGCKWNFFADSNFGVYGNQIDVYQRVYSPGGGTVRFVGTGGDATIRSSEESVAFLGEARLGAGYQLTCNCRATAAFRVIAISGVALSVEQIPGDFSNAELVSYIDSNDSIVLHGLQTGLEWKY